MHLPTEERQVPQMPKKEKRVDIGGQAVMEGVMMKAPDAIAIAVRRPDGEIVLKRDAYVSPASRHKWMGWPIVRGVVNMVNMLVMGMSSLDASTKMLGVLEEEPSRFEKWLSAKLGKSIDKVVMGVAIVLAVALSVLLFIMIPSFVGSLLNRAVSSLLVVNLVSGLVRIAILILYIGLTGLLPDIRRTYQYHGAEHKTVYCHEAGLPLTPENARRFSCLHPRCGTSFLLLVMIISILLGAISDQLLHLIFGVEQLSFLARFARSILLLPVVAGVSYEVLKGLAHSDAPLVRALRWPGLMLQHLTTREPDDRQLEVAIASMNAALHGLPAENPAAEAAAQPAENPAAEAAAQPAEKPAAEAAAQPEGAGAR